MHLLRRLSELQEAHGYLSPEVLRELARRENVPLYRLQGLVSFYTHFRTTPPPRVEIAVCRDASCWLSGASACHRWLRRELHGVPGCDVTEVSCLGRCDQAPAAAINGQPVPLYDLDQVKR
jgi:formate dehydrogenase/NADH-quinone oxidoreductase subunit F